MGGRGRRSSFVCVFLFFFLCVPVVVGQGVGALGSGPLAEGGTRGGGEEGEREYIWRSCRSFCLPMSMSFFFFFFFYPLGDARPLTATSRAAGDTREGGRER